MPPFSESSSSSATDSSAALRRGYTLFALLGLVLITAGVVRWRHRAAAKDNPLHGDSEEATGALSRVLAATPEAQKLPLLLRNVGDASPGLRYAAIDELGHFKTPQAADAIENAFTDSASTVRQRAMENLIQVDTKRGLRLQLIGLRDEDLWIREAAIQQLSLLPRSDPKAARQIVPALLSATSDSSEVVSGSAMHLLAKITGKSWKVRQSMTEGQKVAVAAQWQAWGRGEGAKWQGESANSESATLKPIRPTRTDPAPNFEIKDVDGKLITLAGQRGRVTLLNFWGSWCGPCQKEVPDLVKLNAAFMGRPFDLIGIAMSESEGAEGLRKWCGAHGIAYRQALAIEAVTDAFGHIEEVPVSVLLDAQGRIRYRWEGERDFATFSAAVQRLLDEAAPAH